MDKESYIKPYLDFITIIMFLLTSNPLLKLSLSVIYIILTSLSGSRVRIVPNIILFLSIMIISIITPKGLILLKLGPLTVTKGAIYSGIYRSSLLIGLLYLSKNITSARIKLKGNIGLILRDTFHYFNQLTSGEKIKFSNFLSQIDEKLMELKPYSKDEEISLTNTKSFTYPIFIISLIFLILDKLLDNF